MHAKFDELAIRGELSTADLIYSNILSTRSISAKAVDGNLFIRSPHPPAKRREVFTENRYALEFAIEKIVSQLTMYTNKLIHIVNVYPTKNTGSRILDFDNYDLKNLIDMPCRIYPGNDSPEHTEIRLRTVFSDDLLPMTYLVVTGTDYNSDILQALLSVFPLPAQEP